MNVQYASRPPQQPGSLEHETSPTHGPSSYQQTSPLTTLVRKASARRVHQELDSLQPPIPHTPSRKGQPGWNSPTSPVSPLLHAQFRDSTTTTSSYIDRNSYLVDGDQSSALWSEGEGAIGGADGSRPTSRGSAYSESQNARIQSMASVYSDVDEFVADYGGRQSWQPVEPLEGSRTSYTAGRHRIQPQAQAASYSAAPVSGSEQLAQPITPLASAQSRGSGRSPSQLPPEHRLANFSRPVPPVIDGTEQRKREVLMRNMRAASPFANNLKHDSTAASIVPSIRVQEAEPVDAYGGFHNAPQHQASPGDYAQPSGMPRAASPSANSMYSSYSYYPYDGNTNTPPNSNSPHAQGYPESAMHPSNRSVASPTPSQAPPRQESYELSAPDALQNPRTPQDFLQLGITHHIANRLEESAQCFEKSATLDNGCGVGMLMWGLTLRHGWGVPKNEEKGFKWLRKAAEGAVTDLESAKAGMDTNAIQVSHLRFLGVWSIY